MAKKRTAEQIKQAIADADARGSSWLADANEAEERGNHAKAEACYAKGQFWLDRSNNLRDQLIEATRDAA